MNALGTRIARLIEVQGPLSIAQFMTLALLDPTDGYYATRDPFGAQGDFVTSPEISQIFGELVGLWCVQAWLDQGKPSPARLVELGPGHGTLMEDVLRAAACVPEFLDRVEVTLVEASHKLRAVQEERLSGKAARISWTGRYDDTLADRALFVIANEFFDALPIRQYVRTERGWCERMVIADGAGGLAFALAPLPTPLACDAHAPVGAVFEMAPAALAFAQNIGRTIGAKGGAGLIIDYGHAASGFGDTFQAVGGHAFRNVLEQPGTVDLTAHVDFARLAEAARAEGARSFGPVGQGVFLEALGIRTRAGELAARNPEHASAVNAAVGRLTAADQMGTLFKALAIMPAYATKPIGF